MGWIESEPTLDHSSSGKFEYNPQHRIIRFLGRFIIVCVVAGVYSYNITRAWLYLPNNLVEKSEAGVALKELTESNLTNSTGSVNGDALQETGRSSNFTSRNSSSLAMKESVKPKKWLNEKQALAEYLTVISPGHGTNGGTDGGTNGDILDEGHFSFHAEWHPRDRSLRFPSVYQRIKLYSGEEKWLQGTCKNNRSRYDTLYSVTNDTVLIPSTRVSYIFDNGSVQEDIRVSAHLSEAGPGTNQVILLRRDLMETCFNQNRHVFAKYCRDALVILDVAERVFESSPEIKDQEMPPIFVRFGDSGAKWPGGSVVDVPIFKKFRNILPSDREIKISPNQVSDAEDIDSIVSSLCMSTEISNTTTGIGDKVVRELEPFVWNLNVDRHFKKVPSVPYNDRPWHYKKNVAVWRGTMTGRNAIKFKSPDTRDECIKVPRCRLVLTHLDMLFELQSVTNSSMSSGKASQNKTLIDAKFAKCSPPKGKAIGSRPIDSHPMATEPCKNVLDLKKMLEYKIIIMLEGNDVASGLKWALFSQSVVMMPIPTRMSWAMESYLEPWVHFIPIDEDLSNIEERVNWVFSHDKEANQIAERATLFMYDLLYHPKAAIDDALVKEGLIKVYWLAL